MLTGEQSKNILRECSFRTSRSGGKGGQNVNKLETKVEIEFNVLVSESLTPAQKEMIIARHPALSEEGVIKITSSRHRTQLENKEEVKEKLLNLINKLLKPVKKRFATKPTRASKQRKTESKKRRSDIKNLRKKLF